MSSMQEMGFDSIPFEEPELFRSRSGLQALSGSKGKEDQSLNLNLDSQDVPDTIQVSRLSRLFCTPFSADDASSCLECPYCQVPYSSKARC